MWTHPAAPAARSRTPGWLWLLPVTSLLAVALLVAAAVVVSDLVRDRQDDGRVTAVAGRAPLSDTLVLPDEFAGWRRATDPGTRALEEDPYAAFGEDPEDVEDDISDAVYREYRRGQGSLTALRLTTVGEYQRASADDPVFAVHDVLTDKGVSIGTTMPVDRPSQALACGDATDELDVPDLVVCAYYEADALLLVGVVGAGLDIAGAARLTKQLVAVASWD